MIAFTSFAAFLAMGGHGAYVWSAYGLCLSVLALNVVLPVMVHRRYVGDLARRRRREELS
jgi:heme exporter protein D